MAASLHPFNKLQMGMEVVSTKGTLVPATRLIVGEHGMTEEQEFYRSAYPAGFRANVGGAGVIIRKGVGIDIDTELTAEEILWFLETGVKGSVTGVVTDTTAYTWTFTPELTTGVPTIQSATVEMVRADGVTNHYYGEAGYAMTESFKIDWAFNQIAKLSARMFARARQTGTPTGGLVEYTTREALVSNLLAIYWDTTWAGLGGTPLTGLVRSGSFECTTGYAPDYVLDGRTDADFGLHKVGLITGKLSLVIEFDAVGAAKFALYRSNSLVYIRLKTTGSLAGAVSAVKTVQIDGAYRFVSPPSFSADGEQVLVTMELESVYDTTGAKTLEFVAINKLATIA